MWPLEGQIRDGLLRERLMSWLAVCFGVLAGLLAAVGIYGVTAYSVARRTSEIAIRLALGARAPDVRRLVVRQAARPIAAGLVIGAAATLLVGPLIRALALRARARRSSDDGCGPGTATGCWACGCVGAGRARRARVARRGTASRLTGGLSPEQLRQVIRPDRSRFGEEPCTGGSKTQHITG